MPITAEIDNVRKLESVGFSHDKAVVLAEIHEATAQNSVQELKEFIRAEVNGLRIEINGLRVEMNNLELRMKASQSDLLVKIFGIIFGCSSLAVTVLKLIL